MILFAFLVDPAEKFQKYRVYEHVESGEYLVRTTSYSLPKYLHEHVEVVQPTTSFGRFKKQVSTLSIIEDAPLEAESSCNKTITITCLQQLYNAVGYKPLADGGNRIGITAYLEQYANIQDLQSFYREQRPDALNTTFDYFSINGMLIPTQPKETLNFDNPLGGINSQNLSSAGAEANLDVQFAYGLSFPTPVYSFSHTFYYRILNRPCRGHFGPLGESRHTYQTRLLRTIRTS